MKYIKFIGILIAMIPFGIAQAQDISKKGFEGFYGQIGVGYQKTNITYAGTLYGAPSDVSLAPGASASYGITGNIGAGYTFALNSRFTLGFGAEYYPVVGPHGTYTLTSTTSGVSSTGSGSYHTQNMYNLFISPGIVINDDGLAYLKIGYTSASVKTQVSGSLPIAGRVTNSSGPSFGIGYKQFITDSLYGFGEFNYQIYEQVTSRFPGSTGGTLYNSNQSSVQNLLVGIGYRY